MTLSLRIFPPILLGTGSAMDITGDVVGWRRSVRQRGGYWMGDFSIIGPEKDLARIFYEYLGGHFEERSKGKKTWEGMVYEADLTYQPRGDGMVVTRRRSLDQMYNYVNGKYTKPDGKTGSLAVVKNDASIARYGRRQEYLLLNNVKTSAAEARRNTMLKEYAWPWPRVASISATPAEGEALLEVSVVGYILTANWRYRTTGDGSDGNVSTFIGDLITTDTQFLKKGKITTNTLQVTKGSNGPIRAGDLMLNLSDLGDSSGNPWSLFCGNDRFIVYDKIPVTPSYFLRGGHLFSTAGSNAELDPWSVLPGVYRDVTYPVQSSEYSAWLQDSRNFFVAEVEVGTGNGLVLKTDYFDEGEIMAAQAEYRQQLKGGGSGGGRETTNWRRKFAKEFEAMGLTKEVWSKKAGDKGFYPWRDAMKKKAKQWKKKKG